MAVDRRCRRLGDLVAGTLVEVKRRQEGSDLQAAIDELTAVS